MKEEKFNIDNSSPVRRLISQAKQNNDTSNSDMLEIVKELSDKIDISYYPEAGRGIFNGRPDNKPYSPPFDKLASSKPDNIQDMLPHINKFSDKIETSYSESTIFPEIMQ